VSQNPPALVVIDAVDVDGDPLSYEFQISTSPDFQGGDLEESGPVTAGPQLTSWTPAALLENTTYHWRARATDGAIDGPWASSTFFVDSLNEPPSSPLPVSPADGSVLDATQAALTVLDAVDPESDLLSYEVELRREGVLVLDSAGIAETAVATSFQPPELRPGSYAWKARAVDARGGVGAWSGTASFRITSAGSGGGCGCDLGGGGASGPVAPAALAFVLGAALVKRRRSA
jgi:MYXO-CTERM domain-containing protein